MKSIHEICLYLEDVTDKVWVVDRHEREPRSLWFRTEKVLSGSMVVFDRIGFSLIYDYRILITDYSYHVFLDKVLSFKYGSHSSVNGYYEISLSDEEKLEYTLLYFS